MNIFFTSANHLTGLQSENLETVPFCQLKPDETACRDTGRKPKFRHLLMGAHLPCVRLTSTLAAHALTACDSCRNVDFSSNEQCPNFYRRVVRFIPVERWRLRVQELEGPSCLAITISAIWIRTLSDWTEVVETRGRVARLGEIPFQISHKRLLTPERPGLVADLP
jgi:hypothetical protein